ncbi:bifunctional DNA primase/polymerase [Bacillus sp. 7884-1]|uniref:bifunctional DNA primase/polymerase n=1 Tax=Bacillus sp. 7884-1 TaxID=2021693 RepID=UPI001154F94E|nr:bifunctional DNA primase/polymerase [Bacillus sp. 7884-1]
MNIKNSAYDEGAIKYSTNDIISKLSDFNTISGIFPGAKIIKLKGYSALNIEQEEFLRYKKAKVPIEKGFNDLTKPGLTDTEIESWLEQKGWIGLVVPVGIDVIDIDDKDEGNLIFNALQAESLKFHAIETVNGYQFIFKSSGRIQKQRASFLMAGGFIGDYRLGGKGQIVLPTINTPGRNWVKIVEKELSETPIFFDCLKKSNKNERPFPFPVREGLDGRNDTLYYHCSRLIEFGYNHDQLILILSFLNQRFFLPPLEEEEFYNTIYSASKHKPSGTNYYQTHQYEKARTDQEKKSQAQFLLEICADVELFHTPEDEVYAQIQVNNHLETRSIKSKGFKLWLTKNFYESHNKPPGSQALTDAIGVLEAKALFEGKRYNVYTRVAEHGNAIYIDLCNENWEAVEITGAGWSIVSNPPVRFRRSNIMKEMPKPLKDGTLSELKPFINFKNENDWKLIVAWLIAAFRPGSPYPILTIQGEQGSAKSTTTKILLSLIDPSTLPLRALPSEERDLSIAAKNTWVLSFDNLSGLSNAMSDALCKLSTGGGLSTRKLYTDDEEAIFNIMRPAIINGIDDIAKRQDLLDRSLVLFLPAIPSNQRTDESTFWQKYEAVKPSILGALFEVVSGALKELPNAKLNEKPRMADFALWITAAETTLKWSKGSFMEAYNSNRNEAIEQGLESDPVGVAVQSFMKNRDIWEGTVDKTLTELSRFIGDEKTKYSNAWPTARKLKERFRRIAPALRAKGIEYIDLPRRSEGSVLRLEKVDKTSALSTLHAQIQSNQEFDGVEIV